MGNEDSEPRWRDHSSEKGREEGSAEEIGYEEAAEYQQTEFGPLVTPDGSSARTYRLNRREGYSPTEGDKPRVGGALASALGLTEAQTDEVYTIMSELNLSAFGSQRRLETVVLGVITVVVNYDRFQRQRNPDASRISESRPFRQLMMEFDTSYSDLGTVKRVVKKELKEMGHY